MSSLDELRAMIAVADGRSFTAAARSLGLTTNAVSLRVQRLEAALGVRLFVRTTRSVVATEEARSFCERIARILGELDAAEAELHPSDRELSGTVRLAVPGAVATRPLHLRLGELLTAHPKLRVQLRVANRMVTPAAEGLDIALAVGQPPESTFVGRLLGRVTWVLAAAPSYLDRRGRPRVPADLARHDCLRLLSRPAQEEWTLVDRRGRELSVRVPAVYEADDSRALGDAAYAGLGIGIRPAGECQRAQQAGALERVLPSYRFQPLDIYALLPPGRLRIPRVAACLEVVRAAILDLA